MTLGSYIRWTRSSYFLFYITITPAFARHYFATMFKLSDKRLLLAGLFTQLLPSIGAVSFPAAAGSFNTSLTTSQLIDHNRLDPYASTPQPRALMISLFHPVPPAACCPTLTPYMDPISATFEDEVYASVGIPAGAFGSLTLQTCKTCNPRRRVKESNYPLVLFSPGLGNSRLLYSAIAQQYVFPIFCVLAHLSLQSTGLANFCPLQTVQHWLYCRNHRPSLRRRHRDIPRQYHNPRCKYYNRYPDRI